MASPYDHGVRLLAFNDKLEDLSYCSPSQLSDPPRELYVVGTNRDCHQEVVLSTAFSPHHYTLVTGCRGGSIVWHQPRFWIFIILLFPVKMIYFQKNSSNHYTLVTGWCRGGSIVGHQPRFWSFVIFFSRENEFTLKKNSSNHYILDGHRMLRGGSRLIWRVFLENKFYFHENKILKICQLLRCCYWKNGQLNELYQWFMI